MPLIDSHAHLSSPALADQIDEVLHRCQQVDVQQIITIGTDLNDARAAVELARRHPSLIKVAAGFHPHEASKCSSEDVEAMSELWKSPGIVACGEMGLDYHYDFAPRDVQQTVFTDQLALAAGLNFPIVIHCREALSDTVPILTDQGFENKAVVFHCFTGTQEEADRIAHHGWRISFTGVVTFKRSTELQQIAKRYPADQIMIETDSPYLSPVPVRGKQPNEPGHLVHTARFLAELRNTPFDEFVEQTSKNTRLFFNL